MHNTSTLRFFTQFSIFSPTLPALLLFFFLNLRRLSDNVFLMQNA